MVSVTWGCTRASFSEASPALKIRNLKFRGREGLPQTNAMKKVDSERASERKRNRETQKDRKGKRENDAPQIETAKCT
jgi:hypothetical protein